MAQNPKPRSSLRFPLWIIAVSLLIIALCLVVQLAQQQLKKDQAEASLAPTPVENPPPRQPRLPAATTPSQFRASRLSSASTQSVNTVEGESVAVAVEASAQSIEPALPAGAAPPGGGLAPLANGSGLNSSGEIVGKVRLRGSPPPEQPLSAPNANCPEPLRTRFFTVSSNGGLAGAVVFLKELPAKSRLPIPTNTVEIRFTNCQIEPWVSAARVGQPIRFSNSGRVPHYVRILIAAPGDRLITVQLGAGDDQRQITVKSAGTFFQLRCVNHPWETAYLSTFDHPWFAVTDDQGDFRIANVPPGKYAIEALYPWATGTNGLARPVLVSAGEVTAMNFTIDLPAHGTPAPVAGQAPVPGPLTQTQSP